MKGFIVIRPVLVAFGCVLVSYSAWAQNASSPFNNSSAPTYGGAGVAAPTQGLTIGASGATDVLRHRDFTGRPCLAVGGFARPETINPKLYDDVITVVNSCPKTIALKVCYYQSQDCIQMQVAGEEQKEAVLGTLPAVKTFQFEFREKFSGLPGE